MDIYQTLSLLFLCVTAIATTMYAILSWKLAQPLVSLMTELDPFDNLTMNLIIENVGSGTAEDVKFEAVPDFEISHNRYLSQTGLFKNGIAYFPPHQKIKLYLTWMPSDYQKKIENPITINVNYKNSLKKAYNQKFIIDFTLFGEMPPPGNPISKVAESLEKIERKCNYLHDDLNPIRVMIVTKEEIKKEIEEIIKEKSD